jgi:NADH-quinone oxidoreductase subunit M
MGELPVLSILIFLPIAAAIVCLLVPGSGDEAGAARWVGLLASLATLAVAALALIDYAPGERALRFEEQVSWIPQLGIGYHLGADGLNILLIALTTILTPPAILASWNLMGSRPRLFVALILLLEGAVIGALSALDLILYFVFWEAMLIPMYLLISTFGGARRGFAALKFFIYTSVGSLLMLLAMLYLSYAHSSRIASASPSFDLRDLIGTPLSAAEGRWLFLAFALAFAIKLPLFPLHSWLPDAYTQSPVTVLVLATMLVKVGAYSFLRFAIPLFPEAAADLMPVLAILATIGIIYGGLAAAAQRDMVRLLAYSSLAHLGFIGLGLFALDLRGAQGSLLQMVNHGVSSGALFLIAGFIAARVGTFDIASLGGLARRWPILTGTFVLAAFSSLGLPGLNGFVGEFLILLGAFRTQRPLAIVATFGVLLAAIYVLRLFRGTMYGRERLPAPVAGAAAGDLNLRELAALAPLLILIVWIGVYPSPFLRRTEGAVVATLSAVHAPAPTANGMVVGATLLTSTSNAKP